MLRINDIEEFYIELKKVVFETLLNSTAIKHIEFKDNLNLTRQDFDEILDKYTKMVEIDGIDYFCFVGEESETAMQFKNLIYDLSKRAINNELLRMVDAGIIEMSFNAEENDFQFRLIKQ